MLLLSRAAWLIAGWSASELDVALQAFKANPDSEEIWLAAFKLEFENGEVVRARGLLTKVTVSLCFCRCCTEAACLPFLLDQSRC